MLKQCNSTPFSFQSWSWLKKLSEVSPIGNSNFLRWNRPWRTSGTSSRAPSAGKSSRRRPSFASSSSPKRLSTKLWRPQVRSISWVLVCFESIAFKVGATLFPTATFHTGLFLPVSRPDLTCRFVVINVILKKHKFWKSEFPSKFSRSPSEPT